MKGARILAIRLPTVSLHKAEAEYSGTTDSLGWTQLVWSAQAASTAAGSAVTYQLYDWQAASYPTSGDGFISYTTSATPNTFETQSQTISASPQNFRSSGGAWKMKAVATATSTSWVGWKGDQVRYNPTGTLSTDIVDAGGSSVLSPSVSFAASATGFACSTTTGTLGTSSQKLRAINPSDTPSWTLSIAASSPTSVWSAGTPTYDFNDGSGAPAGCSDGGGDADSVAGQLTIDASAATLAAIGSGCTTTGVSKGSAAAFAQGTTDSITLLAASGSADLACVWDLTGVSASQKIPAEQAVGAYSLNLTISIVAS